MINVEVLKDKELIKTITVNGHADYAENGQDIVCAGVSAVVIGGINAIDELDEDVVFDVSMNEDITGHITYRSIESTKKEQIILNTIIISLKTIESSYQKFVKIKTREVKTR